MIGEPEPRQPSAQELDEEVRSANIPALLMVVYQVTGDERWLRPPYLPTRSKGLGDHDSGGLPEDVQEEVREAGRQALLAMAQGRTPAVEVPDAEQTRRMLEVCVGEPVDASYGAMFAQEFRRRVGAVEEVLRVPPTDFRVLVIGAGVSGIIAAHRLGRMGIDHLVVDRHDGPGGNWLDNRYPGAGVDTPSHLYSFSFAPRDWSHHFELRPELEQYFAETFDRVGARGRTRFGTEVVRAVYDAGGRTWSVDLCGPGGRHETIVVNAIISAVGILNRPLVPDLPGLETFAGRSFHSAEWPADIDVAGKRVVVVGSGASAMQIVPAIAPVVEHLTVFQRTPPWIAPFEKFRRPIDAGARHLLRTSPLYRTWYWLKLYWQFGDKVLDALRKDPDWPHPERAVNARNDGHREFFTQYIRDELGDRSDLFDKVLPSYPPFGKRILLDNGWYEALRRPNVELVAEGVAGVVPEGVHTGSGAVTEADVLVWATGFTASRFVSSLEIVGRGGVSLREAWDDDDARAYLGVTVPGFPNLFLLGGPNSFPGSGSFMYFMEVQMRYVERLIASMIDLDIPAIDVRRDVFDEYADLVDRTSATTVWTHPGTDTFFRNSRGRLVFVSPFRNVEYWTRAENAGLEDYDIVPAADAVQAASGSPANSRFKH